MKYVAISRQKTTRHQMARSPVDLDDIHRFLDHFADAQSRGDLEDTISHLAADVTVFDMMPPLVIRGKDEYREVLKQYFTDMFRFPVEFEWRDLDITVEGTTAVCHGLSRIAGTFKETGEPMSTWVRTTLVLGRETGKDEGRWLIRHLHVSVPAGDDGVALMDLEPESSTSH